MAQHRILVPMDFTPVSDIALEHAIVVGKAFESEIMLLHIIGSKKEMTDARLRMEAWNEKAAAAYPHTVRTAVRIGSIFGTSTTSRWNKTPTSSSWAPTDSRACNS